MILLVHRLLATSGAQGALPYKVKMLLPVGQQCANVPHWHLLTHTQCECQVSAHAPWTLKLHRYCIHMYTCNNTGRSDDTMGTTPVPSAPCYIYCITCYYYYHITFITINIPFINGYITYQPLSKRRLPVFRYRPSSEISRQVACVNQHYGSSLR